MKKISFRTDVLPLKNAIYRLALRITLNPADAEDIVQDTLMKVWNRRDTWDEIESMESYCLTICRNLSLDRIDRHESRNASIEEQSIDQADNASTPLDSTVAHDNVDIVRDIIDSLPEKQRSCVQLRDFEGKAYKDIATVLDITEQQVKVNIFRARQTIKKRFTELNSYGL